MTMKLRCLVLLALVLGCGGAAEEPIKVTGTVKNADGSPVTGESGTIVFRPEGEGKSASGAIGPDGAFELMTSKPGDGVAPGSYKVELKVWKSYRDQTLAVPEQYADAAKSPLTATVDAEHKHFDFVVEP